jgi:hypothetical protein
VLQDDALAAGLMDAEIIDALFAHVDGLR